MVNSSNSNNSNNSPKKKRKKAKVEPVTKKLRQLDNESNVEDMDVDAIIKNLGLIAFEPSEHPPNRLNYPDGKRLLITNMTNIYDQLVSGETITNICKKLGVQRQTWYELEQQSQHFQKLIESAKTEQVENVKRNLLTKCGDRYVTVDKVLPNGKVVQYQQYIPADFNAQKFFLLNKASEEFKEKQEITVKKQEFEIDIIDVEGFTVVEDGEDNNGNNGNNGNSHMDNVGTVGSVDNNGNLDDDMVKAVDKGNDSQ